MNPDAESHLFLIAANNSRVHVYPDVSTMLKTDAGAFTSGGFEFFNTTGSRLVPVFDGSWALLDLRKSGDRPNERMVNARLCAVLEFIRATIGQRITQGTYPDGAREEALRCLPELKGESLDDCYKALEPWFGDAPNGGIDPVIRHDGGWLHNLLCH